MKRILVSLLFFSLFLSSCESTVHEHTDINTELAETTPVFTIDGELPDIGEFYGNKPQERFYEEYTPKFIPSDEYGEVIPFIGMHKEYSGADMHSIGFCTPDGKIVMDAIFNISYPTYCKTDDGFEYYRVFFDNPDNIYAQSEMIIHKSGEHCLMFDEHTRIYSIEGGIIISGIYDGKTSFLTVSDYYGNTLTTFDGLFCRGDYKHGLLPVSNLDEDVYYYIDLEGNIVLGPYKNIHEFNNEGTAHITDMAGNEYLIDIYGNRITDKDYVYIYYKNELSCYVATHKYNQSLTDILDASGKYVNTVPRGSFFHYGKYLNWYTTTENGNTSYHLKSVTDGIEIISKEYKTSPDYPDGVHDNVFVSTLENGQVIFDQNGETIAFLDSEYTFGWISDDCKYIVCKSGKLEYDYITGGYTKDTRKTHIYDVIQDKIVYTHDDIVTVGTFGENERYILLNFIIDINNSEYVLFDTTTGKICLEDYQLISYKKFEKKGYYNISNKNVSTLYDENFNVILKTYSE